MARYLRLTSAFVLAGVFSTAAIASESACPECDTVGDLAAQITEDRNLGLPEPVARIEAQNRGGREARIAQGLIDEAYSRPRTMRLDEREDDIRRARESARFRYEEDPASLVPAW